MSLLGKYDQTSSARLLLNTLNFPAFYQQTPIFSFGKTVLNILNATEKILLQKKNMSCVLSKFQT